MMMTKNNIKVKYFSELQWGPYGSQNAGCNGSSSISPLILVPLRQDLPKISLVALISQAYKEV